MRPSPGTASARMAGRAEGVWKKNGNVKLWMGMGMGMGCEARGGRKREDLLRMKELNASSGSSREQPEGWSLCVFLLPAHPSFYFQPFPKVLTVLTHSRIEHTIDWSWNWRESRKWSLEVFVVKNKKEEDSLGDQEDFGRVFFEPKPKSATWNSSRTNPSHLSRDVSEWAL